MKLIFTRALALLLFTAAMLQAQVPQLVNYQGRVAVGTTNFNGSGSFRFALVNAAGTTTYWSNDDTSSAGSQPTAAVSLTVTKGLYSVLLGDISLTNMTAIPASVWANADVRLRVWFNDGTNGSQLLTPDQRLAPNGYLPDNSVGSAAIASGAITSTKIAAGAVGPTQIAAGAVANTQLTNSALTVTAGAGLGGGGAVSLGGNVTLNNAGVLSLNGGGGITVNAATGAVTLGSNATSANIPGTLVMRDGDGYFAAGTIVALGAFNMPTTTGASTGLITQNDVRLLHTFGTQNFFAGQAAGNFTMTGGYNTASGFAAFQNNTTGASNTASGYAALQNNTTGFGNTASGFLALYSNTTGFQNTASGYQSLYSNTTGSANTASGQEALYFNTTGGHNTANGFQALFANTSGIQNTAAGFQALRSNTTGVANTASGYQALNNNTTGNSNTASGFLALYSNTTGGGNTASGQQALFLNTTGDVNTASGYQALHSNTTGFQNTASGFQSLFSNTEGAANTAGGFQSLYSNTTGVRNFAGGFLTLFSNTTGSDNTASGYQALASNTTGNYNTASGREALYANTGSNNIALGFRAGNVLTSGNDNIDIGNVGVAGESAIIRIGTPGTHTDTFLTGIIHGNGSGLTGITSVSLAANSITSTQIADGAVGPGKVGTGAINVGNLLATGAPVSGQVLSYDGTNLTWTSPASGIWSVSGIGYPYYNGGGFVGIGTNSPAAGLHIVNSSGNTLRLDGATPRINFFDTGNSNALTAIGAQAGSFYVANNQTGNLMQLTATGSLGLGTTLPQSRLHISGAADALRLTGPQPYLTLDNTTAGFISRIQANGGGMDLKTNGAAINNHPGIIHLDQSGTVGLGTTTPRHQLSINYFNGGPVWTSNGWIGAIDLNNGGAIAWDGAAGGYRFGMGSSNGNFFMWHTTADPGTVGSPAFYDFAITNNGYVGIGTTGPVAKLHVSSGGDVNTPQAQVTQTTSGDYARLRFNATGSPSAWDIATGGSGGAMNFYATSTGRNVMSLNPNGTTTVQVLTITGGSDLAEPFPMKEELVEKGSVVVIDDEHPGRLKRSRSAYDTRVAGIVSGANGVNPGIALHQEGILEGGQNVALTGRVYVRAEASGGPIKPGDLLTTSDVPGHAMKVADHARAQGAILGKAMSSLESGEGMVLVLVTLQ